MFGVWNNHVDETFSIFQSGVLPGNVIIELHSTRKLEFIVTG